MLFVVNRGRRRIPLSVWQAKKLDAANPFACMVEAAVQTRLCSTLSVMESHAFAGRSSVQALVATSINGQVK